MITVWWTTERDGTHRYDHLSYEDELTESTVEWIAGDIAAYYWSNCDGWEDRWPVTFYIYESETAETPFTVEVQMEMEPVFCGYVQK